MNIPTTREIISLLQQVSVTVDEYISEQQYLVNTSVDTIDEEGILTQCYCIIIDELKDRGIEFHIELDQLLSSWYEAERIYHLYCFTELEQQVKICIAHTNLIPKLLEVIDNSIDEDILSDWFIIVEPYIQQNRHRMPVQSILEYTHTTEIFKQLLATVYKKVEHAIYDYTQPMDAITSYIKEMNSGRIDAAYALKILEVNNLLSSLNDIQNKIIHKSIKYYDMAKLEVDAISEYAWAYSVQDKVDELSEELKQKYEQLEYDHHSSTDHHIEYYIVHKDVPIDKLACILLSIGCYDKDNDILVKNAERVLRCGVELFVVDTKQFFIECITTLKNGNRARRNDDATS